MALILDVAREADVAPSTVSLVANGDPRVAPKTRRRVQAVIKRMNYQPRSARRKKRNIGVVYGRGMVLSGELVDYCRQWIAGIHDSLDDPGVNKGANVHVNVGAKHVDEDLMFQRAVEERDFDGLILMGVQPWDGYLAAALKSGLPTVAMNHTPRHTEFSSVCADAYAAGTLAADHLLELGHRRLGLVLSDRPDQVINRLHEGFVDTLARDGLSPALSIQSGESLRFQEPATFEPLARQMLDAGTTACFTGDPVALRMADAMAGLGVDVPAAFSVLGWDDLGFVTRSGQRLTSIGYEKQTMGLLAGQMLQNLMSMGAGLTNLTATVPVRLVPGATTGPCPSST